MKMKKGSASVVFLLATSSMMAAMSFSSAEVKSDTSFTVKNSNDALVALIANADHAAPGYSGSVALDIVTVKNNSEKEITVKVKANKQGNGTNGVAEQADVSTSSWYHPPGPVNPPVATSETLTITDGNSSNEVEFTLAPGTTKDILVLYHLKILI